MSQVITLEIATKNLESWLEADRAAALGQSYKVGSRELTRVNAKEIRENIKYWRGEVNRLTKGQRKGAKATRIIVRDI